MSWIYIKIYILTLIWLTLLNISCWLLCEYRNIYLTDLEGHSIPESTSLNLFVLRENIRLLMFTFKAVLRISHVFHSLIYGFNIIYRTAYRYICYQFFVNTCKFQLLLVNINGFYFVHLCTWSWSNITKEMKNGYYLLEKGAEVWLL